MRPQIHQIAHIAEHDSEAFAAVRMKPGLVALALSIEANGDLEVFLTPQAAAEIAKALQIAAGEVVACETRVSRSAALRVEPNPSIDRTCQRPLRALWPAAHVKR